MINHFQCAWFQGIDLSEVLGKNKIDIPYNVLVCDGDWRVVRNNPHFFNTARGTPVVLSGEGPTSVLARRVSDALEIGDRLCTLRTRSGSCLNDLLGSIHTHPDYFLAVGGGSVIDCAKVLATEFKVPLILVPTTLSSDAMCSPIARVPGENIRKKVKSPALIILDVGLIASGPTRLLISGIGDLISNVTACVDWSLAHKLLGDLSDSYNHLSCAAAINAVFGFFGQTVDLNLEKDKKEITLQLARAHILSGLAMSIAGSSRPCSGSEHLISHAMDNLFPGRATHGEQVGLASYYVAKWQREFLVGNPLFEEEMRLLAIVDKFFEKYPIPQKPSDIGYTDEEFSEAVLNAPSVRRRTTVLNLKRLGDLPFDAHFQQ